MIRPSADLVKILSEYVNVVEEVVAEQKLTTMSTDAVVAIAAGLYQIEVFQEIADNLSRMTRGAT